MRPTTTPSFGYCFCYLHLYCSLDVFLAGKSLGGIKKIIWWEGALPSDRKYLVLVCSYLVYTVISPSKQFLYKKCAKLSTYNRWGVVRCTKLCHHSHSAFSTPPSRNDNEPLHRCLVTCTDPLPLSSNCTCQNELIMLWVDKHRPTKLEDLSYHDNITERLQSLTANPDAMPHLFFYGPAGSGKKTRITALLRSLYGPGAERLKLDRRTFTTPTKRTVEINMITSNCK
jgi:hypothetical protein